MVQLRRILSLALCCSVCLIVCVLPVSAADEWFQGEVTGVDPTEAWWASTPGTFGHDVYYYIMEHVPDSITFDGTDTFMTAETSGYTKVGHGADCYVKVQFDYSGELNLQHAAFYPYFYDYDLSVNKPIGSMNIVVNVDGTDVVGNGNVEDFSYSGNVDSYFSIRCDAAPTSESRSLGGYAIDVGLYMKLAGLVRGPADINDIIDNMTIISGTLENIDGNIVEIVQDVQHIDQIVTDTNNQLQDPESNIWQAAGSVISGAIESLFVPSEQDIANVKQGFDDLAQDKLGGAYTAMETVEDTITQVNDKLNNPSAAQGVEFPGIAVPLGGEVGTVVLAERQMVTLPMELTAILHPLGGTIISIIAGLGTFNVLKDMVECFLSGFSYAEYLHRNKGGSDE